MIVTSFVNEKKSEEGLKHLNTAEDSSTNSRPYSPISLLTLCSFLAYTMPVLLLLPISLSLSFSLAAQATVGRVGLFFVLYIYRRLCGGMRASFASSNIQPIRWAANVILCQSFAFALCRLAKLTQVSPFRQFLKISLTLRRN